MENSKSHQKSYSKITIAVEFLNTAAELWEAGDAYFASMHLAAAAEELAGKACRHAGKASSLDERVAYVTRAVDGLGLSNIQKRVYELMYGAKNSIKHFGSIMEAEVELVPREEAANYIRDAYQNFCALGLQGSLSPAILRVLAETAIYLDIEAPPDTGLV